MAAAVENTYIPVNVDNDDGHEVGNGGVVKGRDGRRPHPRRHRNFRKIPRAPSATRKQEPKGRRRTVSTSSNASGGRRRVNSHRRRNASESSNMSEAGGHAPLKKLRDTIVEKYERKGLNMLNGYIKNKLNMAKFTNNTAFLSRCRVMQVVPSCYRLHCEKIRNTREVIRLLDRFSVHLMEADLHYNKLRKRQVAQFLMKKEQQLKDVFSEEDATLVIDTVKEAYETKFTRMRDAQRKNFDALLKEYAIVIKNKDDKPTTEDAEKTPVTEEEPVAKEEELKEDNVEEKKEEDDAKDSDTKEEEEVKVENADKEEEREDKDEEEKKDDDQETKEEVEAPVKKNKHMKKGMHHGAGESKIIEP